MEEECKDVTSKPLIVQFPAAKPRPVPRKRNRPKEDTSVQNGKPQKIPPKPVLLPKPRRPPPNAPSVKPSEPLNKNVTRDNEVSEHKKPLEEETTENKVAYNSEPFSGKSIDQTIKTQNGPANVDLKDSVEDDQWYEPLCPRQESQLSRCSSEDGYEDIPSPRANKVTPPSPRKRSAVTKDSNPAVPSKVVGTTGKGSPPVSRKIISTASKTSPPVLRKSNGMGIRTSPQLPCKSSEIRQAETVTPNTSPRDHDSSNKSKPLPPKKPLPSLPKGLSGQNVTMETTTASKPPVPQKRAPELAPASSSSDASQPSVAALAHKLSTIPVFPFRDASSGKVGVFPSPGTSPRSSPLSSPRPTTRNAAANSVLEKPTTEATKVNEASKPKLHPKPSTGSLPEKPQTQGHEVQKHPPARPSPPSAAAVARARSRTLESLEDNDGSAAQDDTLAETSEFQKKKLASRVKNLQHGVTRPSNDAVLANRRPPPLPPGAIPVSEKPTGLNRPPLPAVPRPRPASSFEHTQGGAVRPQVSKSVSLGNISKVSSAEEQAEYSYAYDHTLLGMSPPKRALSVQNPSAVPVEDSGGSYVTPDEHVINEFMEDLHEKKAAASYDVADEQAVAGFIDSVRRKKQTLNGLTCELSSDEFESSDSDDHEYTEPPKGEHREADGDDDDDSDSREYVEPPFEETEDDESEDHDDASSVSSFSSDSSHEYCVPPENISPPDPPPHGKEYEDMESIYMEPIHDPSEDAFSSDDDKYNVAEEPLYQVYARCTLQRERSISRQRMSSDVSTSSDESFLEELAKGTLRNMRVLWSELPEVNASGILDAIKPDERKRQEAMFEVITSEASYLRSLNILMSHFINSDELASGSSLCVLERGQSHVLFSNISAIKSVSENFLQALRTRQKEAVVISTISDIIEQHAKQFFEVYVKYCSNQIYQDRALKNLRKSVRFAEAVKRLQSGKEVQGLTLQSFLVLPMQRITRLPLLVNAICHRCEAGSEEFNRTDRALAAINKIVNDCNEGARKMERMEEICVLQTQIEFKTKPLALATPSRYLLRRGDIAQIVEDSRSPLKKLRPKFKQIYMMLFNDLLLLTKKKSENRFQVLDYATRNMTQVDEPNDYAVNVDHLFSLVLLENSEGKTKEFLMAGNSETDKTRWMEAFKPPAAEQEGETVYASWDCPQVNALHNYVAQQPDELSLYEGDVINVLKKLPDGWYHGERLCDGTQGWFPANHTEEILNEHVRARNLRQRYRLLAASKHLIGGTLKL